jgi:nicotinate phosphoribosyltransferase
MKLSLHKQTYPGRKQVYRVVRDGVMVAEVLPLDGEPVPGRPLLQPVMRGGRLVGALPTLARVRRHAARERARLSAGLRSLQGGTVYPVRISPGLRRLVREVRAGIQQAMAIEEGRP